MPITKQINSRANGKQLSPADMPQNPAQIVTNKYTAISTAAQTVINLSFAVDQTNTTNFLLTIDGKLLTEGASNDFTFTNIQPNNTSSQVTLAAAIGASLNIQALYLGVFQANYSLASALASISANTAAIPKNYLINSNFDFWQRGITTTAANTVSKYLADRWYVKNSLGTNGVITFSQVAGVTNGSLFGAKVQITTAPTAAQTNGTELYQVITNDQSVELYNQVISASARIKALGNVTQIGIQFAYATTEVKPTLFLGSEQLVNVNTSTFTLGTLLNQSVGTTPTTAGIVGIRIRIRTVSSGNTYDLNNGFVVEQAMLNVGTTVANYSRSGRTLADELQACQRYYEKSYNVEATPGTVITSGEEGYSPGSQTTALTSIRFKVTKWSVPTMTGYSPGTGTSGQIRNVTDSTDAAVTVSTNAGTSGATAAWTNTAGKQFSLHWTADAEI